MTAVIIRVIQIVNFRLRLLPRTSGLAHSITVVFLPHTKNYQNDINSDNGDGSFY